MTEVEVAMERLLALGGARPRRRWLSLPAGDIHLLEQGSGPPLLLLHGGSGGSANWYRLFADLASSYRVLAPDLPGFGLSPAIPPEPPLGMQAARLAGGLLDALGIARVSVLGTSFGGLAGLRLAQHFPARVERLLLLDSAGLRHTLPWAVRLGTRAPLTWWTLRPSEHGTRRMLRRWLTSSPMGADEEAALIAYLAAVARAHDIPPLALFAGWRGQREVLTAAELASLAVPVLLLWGERDRFFPVRQARAAVRQLQNGRLHVFVGVGHSPNWECPEAVLVQVRRFLAKQT